jgi:hypothetical protein
MNTKIFMHSSRLVCFVLFFCFIETAFSQQQKDILQDDTIPFQLTEYNNIIVPAVLNNLDTIKLMLHTAADAVALTKDVTKNLRSINFSGKVNGVKSWGGAQNSSRYSDSNLLQIGKSVYSNITVWEDENSGQHSDGKFGLNLFANKVIELDFDKQLFIIHTKLPDKINQYQKLQLVFKDDEMFVEANCKIGDSSYKNMFLIHSGYAGDVLLDDKFVADNKMSDKLKITGERDLKDAYNNIIKTKKAILPALQLGDVQLSNVPVGFFEGSIGRQKMSIIGSDILKRFNIIIDAERQYVYLQSNSLSKTDYSKI